MVCPPVLVCEAPLSISRQTAVPNLSLFCKHDTTPRKNRLWDHKLVEGVDKQAAAKGFQKADANSNSDLVVLYHAAVG